MLLFGIAGWESAKQGYAALTSGEVSSGGAASLLGYSFPGVWVKRLLLGESLPADDERRLRELVADFEGVDAIVDFRTVYFGPEEVIVTADVEFDPGFETDGIDDRIGAIENSLMETNPQVRKAYIEPEA